MIDGLGQEIVKTTTDVAGVSVVLAVMLDFIPPVAAVLGVVLIILRCLNELERFRTYRMRRKALKAATKTENGS